MKKAQFFNIIIIIFITFPQLFLSGEIAHDASRNVQEEGVGNPFDYSDRNTPADASTKEIRAINKKMTVQQVKYALYKEIDEHWDLLKVRFGQPEREKLYALLIGLGTRESTLGGNGNGADVETAQEDGFGVNPAHAYGTLQTAVTAFAGSDNKFMVEDNVPELYQYKFSEANFYDAIISNHMGLRKLLHFIEIAINQEKLKGYQVPRAALKGFNTGWCTYVEDDSNEYYKYYPDEIAAMAHWYYAEGHLYDNVFAWTSMPDVDPYREGNRWEWWGDGEPSMERIPGFEYPGDNTGGNKGGNSGGNGSSGKGNGGDDDNRTKRGSCAHDPDRDVQNLGVGNPFKYGERNTPENASIEEIRKINHEMSVQEVKYALYKEIDEHWELISTRFGQPEREKVYAYFLGLGTRESTLGGNGDGADVETAQEEGFGVSAAHAYGTMQTAVTAFSGCNPIFMKEDNVPELYQYELTESNFYDAIISNHMGIRKLLHFVEIAINQFGLKGYQVPRAALKGFNTGWCEYVEDDSNEYYKYYPDEIAAMAHWYYDNYHLYDNVFTWTSAKDVEPYREGDRWEWWGGVEPSMKKVEVKDSKK